ncbi:MAG: hypothetical protein SFV23_22895, partial [Planctomycetaceae bacterium]|nr:hypothetical protein [Planctomycetaceae bacterium]
TRHDTDCLRIAAVSTVIRFVLFSMTQRLPIASGSEGVIQPRVHVFAEEPHGLRPPKEGGSRYGDN